jgi:hypothetical protein
MGKLKPFPLRSGTFSIFIQHSLGIPSQNNEAGEIKGIQIGKQKVKYPYFQVT